MTYYRTSSKTTRAKCDNCGRPFSEHKYVTTDRDGDLHECPAVIIERSSPEAIYMGADCPEGCGPTGQPQLLHHRAGELSREPNALICFACGHRWTSDDAAQVGKAWLAEYRELRDG